MMISYPSIRRCSLNTYLCYLNRTKDRPICITSCPSIHPSVWDSPTVEQSISLSAIEPVRDP